VNLVSLLVAGKKGSKGRSQVWGTQERCGKSYETLQRKIVALDRVKKFVWTKVCETYKVNLSRP
jgi:hypothetical protein